MQPPRPVPVRPAAVLGFAALLAIGWTGLLVPSLIRSIKGTFDQTDAGIGLLYLLYATAYALGSFVGGPATERLGRRRVLLGAAALHAVGIVGLGLAPAWSVFVAVMVPAGFGAGVLDGGANGLFLDLFRSGRGRAMNLLHVSFSIGALAAPLTVGALVTAGVAWQTVVIGTGLVVTVLAVGFGVVAMPSGRHDGEHASAGPQPRSVTGDAGGRAGRNVVPLVLLGVAILAYVASEVGVSNWLVRFLEPAPLETATLALSLFWAGLGVGRVISSFVSDRFDHVRFTAACAIGIATCLIAAIFVPSLPLSIALFALVGVFSGPIFPMIVAIGGERYADRSAAVSGVLIGFGVTGGTIYPPLMGLLSVTVGLTLAMVGTAVLAAACAAALLAFERRLRRE